MYSTTSLSPPKKTNFYYIAHPHEAYLDGHNPYLGNASDYSEEFGAYTFYLPVEVYTLIPKLHEYFHCLIAEEQLEKARMRRKSFLASIDTAVGTLQRMLYHTKTMETTVTLGSKHLAPVTWMALGSEIPKTVYKYHVGSVPALIDYYTDRYKSPCHCSPVCIYQQTKGRQSIDALVACKPGMGIYSPNVVMAAAIHFLFDVVNHCGPDCSEIFDLFTNDLRCSPDNINTNPWRRARERALFGNGVTKVVHQRQMGFAQPPHFTQGPPKQAPVPYKPKRIKIIVTEERMGGLTTGAKTTQFLAIKPDVKNDDDYSGGYW